MGIVFSPYSTILFVPDYGTGTGTSDDTYHIAFDTGCCHVNCTGGCTDEEGNPKELAITLSGIGNYLCDDCLVLNATFILPFKMGLCEKRNPYTGNYSPCEWELELGQLVDTGTGTDAKCPPSVTILARVRVVGMGYELNVIVTLTYPGAATQTQSFTYWSPVPIDCKTLSSVSCSLGPPNHGDRFCDFSSASCTVTGV